MPIAVITDSSGQLPPDLARRSEIEVVPLTISIDGTDYLEGAELSADQFFDMVEPGVSEVTTSQPSVARFVEAFSRAVDRGATEIVAVLVGSAYSGTIDSASLATSAVDVPVSIVDTGTSSFGVGACALVAAEAVRSGAAMDEVVRQVECRADQVESVFILQGLELAMASGRFGDASLTAGEIPVLWAGRGDLAVVETIDGTDADAIEQAVAAMVGRVVDGGSVEGSGIEVALGRAHADTDPISDLLRDGLRANPLVEHVLEYRVGPSIAAHTGPGTAGVFWWPRPLAR